VTVVSIGSLMNDKDFQLKVDRDTLDELCKDLYAKITGPVKDVLKQTGLEIKAFDHVVPFGGGWRVPGLKKVLEADLGISKLDTILNSDEAAAMGAVFMHGNSSGLLKVKPIVLVDSTTPPKSEAFPEPLRGAAMGQAKNLHAKLCEAEEVRKKKETAKSTLEAWIYSVKEKTMEDDMEKVASEDALDELKSSLSKGEDWIYDEGEDADLATYEAKRAEMEKQVADVVERYDELTLRPEATKAATLRVERALKNSQDWATSRPHIPKADLKKLSDKAEALKKWLAEGEAKLTGDGLKDALPFKAADVDKKATELKEMEETLLLLKPKKAEGDL